ncbi:polyketide cyclase [Nocardioides marmoriginsengisoli]|uniref:Polyketide cyclase n=1 Tax=Nocardioides marmoriginsengisoli TaxID=661483 RepID=A0A3N0CDT9_9ACTN|nr:SRPBCC family protein [Nocardioides marmoriginsengisoli]RNL61226.1 polyketide cyclase [Nocardioides marmoriginsengisoli]
MSTVAKHETEIIAPAGVPWIDIIREFDATPDRVFRAHVDPALFAQWIGPRDLSFKLGEWDARTGGRWAYSSGRGEDVFSFYGSFHEIRENERIVQTFTYAGVPDAVALEIARFEALPGGRTRLVNRSIGSSVEERDSMVASGMESGIIEGYQQLDELLNQE